MRVPVVPKSMAALSGAYRLYVRGLLVLRTPKAGTGWPRPHRRRLGWPIDGGVTPTAALTRGKLRGTWVVVLLLLGLPALAACKLTEGISAAPADIDVLDKVRSLDIMPRQTQPSDRQGSNVGRRGQAAVFEGAEISDVGEAPARAAAGSGGYDLNFESTPIATVAKVVIGDILNTGYVIDPRVQGTISLVSVRPVSKSDIVFVLESALRVS